MCQRSRRTSTLISRVAAGPPCDSTSFRARTQRGTWPCRWTRPRITITPITWARWVIRWTDRARTRNRRRTPRARCADQKIPRTCCSTCARSNREAPTGQLRCPPWTGTARIWTSWWRRRWRTSAYWRITISIAWRNSTFLWTGWETATSAAWHSRDCAAVPLFSRIRPCWNTRSSGICKCSRGIPISRP